MFSKAYFKGADWKRGLTPLISQYLKIKQDFNMQTPVISEENLNRIVSTVMENANPKKD